MKSYGVWAMGQPEMRAISFARDETPCPSCGCIIQKQDLIDGKFDVERSPSGTGWVPTRHARSFAESVPHNFSDPTSWLLKAMRGETETPDPAPKAQGGSGCMLWVIALGLPGLYGVTQLFAN
jgi:hypothetical protein